MTWLIISFVVISLLLLFALVSLNYVSDGLSLAPIDADEYGTQPQVDPCGASFVGMCDALSHVASSKKWHVSETHDAD